MIVDDSAPMRVLLRAALTSMGVRSVREAASAGEALEQLHAAPADVLLLDFAMPSMTGPEFLRALDGETARAARPPCVVMISGYEDRGSYDQARGAGVDAFVTKPISFAALVSRLEAAMNGPRKAASSYWMTHYHAL